MKENVLEILNRPIVERALKTFVQAFIATMLVTGGTGRAAFTAALAAAVSATWNYLRAT